MRLPRTLLLLAAAGSLSLLSCKDEPKQAVVSPGSPAAQAAARPALSTNAAAAPANSLLALVPSNAGAFFFWDLASPAYDRLLSSRWGNSYLSKTQTLAAQMPQLGLILKDAGIDLENPAELRKTIHEALVVLTKTGAGPSDAVGGIVLRATDASSASQLQAALKASAEKHGIQTKPADGGYSFEVDTLPVKSEAGPAQIKRLTLTAKNVGDKIILADDAGVLAQLSSPSENGQPPSLAKLSMEAPAAQERVALGYLDAMALLSTDKQKQETPITAAFLSVKMTDRPTVEMRLQKRPGAPEKFEVSAPSKELLAAFPTNPLIFTTLQAGALRDFAAKSSSDAANFMNDSQMAPLKSITQVAIGARAAPQGQSMLPIPELILSIMTTQPKELAAQMTGSAQAAVKGYGLPGSVSEKTIAGHKVQVLPGAFGLSLLVAQLDTAVMASTSEALITESLNRLAQPDPLAGSTLPATALSAAKAPAIGRLYLSFPELVKMLESAKDLAGGMMSSKDGTPSPGAQLMSPQNLKAMSDLGTLLGSMTDQGDELRGELTYL